MNGVSYVPMHGKNGSMDVANGGNVAIPTLFASRSGRIVWASAQDEDQN